MQPQPQRQWPHVAPEGIERRAQGASDRTLRRWAKRKDQRRVANKMKRMDVWDYEVGFGP